MKAYASKTAKMPARKPFLDPECKLVVTIYISRPAAILICMMVLAPDVCLQPRRRVANQSPRHLYRVVNDERKIGFIDQTGRLVIGFNRLPKRTSVVGDFHEGSAVIYLKRKQDAMNNDTAEIAGYIDESGKVVIPVSFDEAHDFSEGLAYVQGGDVRAFINTSGRIVIRFPKKMWASVEQFGYGFHEGLAAVIVGTETGFIDQTGKLRCKGYSSAASFSEGLAAVAFGRGERAKYGFINAKGETVISARFDPVLSRHKQIAALSHFSEGLASVRIGKEYGYIDKSGQFVIPPQFLFAGDFSEGLAFIRVADQAGYIDKSGRLVIVPTEKLSSGGRFREGLAPVGFAARGWGYIDRTGKTIIEPRFFQASEFAAGVAEVEFVGDSHSRYIDKTGKFLWPPGHSPTNIGDRAPPRRKRN